MKHVQVSSYIRGAICGSLWWPVGQLAGSPFSEDMRARFARFARPDAGEHITFRDALLSTLNERGGDFQGALFASGSELVIEFQTWSGTPGYLTRNQTMRKCIPLERLHDCADLVNTSAEVMDFA